MARTQVVSFSEIDSYRQCPLKHQLQYVERWRDRPKPGSARDRGTLWHQVLEVHYRTIQAAQDERGDISISADELAADILGRVSALLYHDRSGEFLGEMHELVYWMYVGYVDQYGVDPNWKVLAVEIGPVVPLYDGATKTRFRLKTKIDLIVRDRAVGDHVWVVDHKSGKDLPSQKELDLDDQFGLYTLALQRSGKRIFGQVYSAARTQRNKTGVQTLESRMSRTRLYRDPRELAVIEADVVKALKEAYRARSGDARSNPSPQECKWKCDFSEAHIAARKSGRPIQGLVADYGFVQDFSRH